MPRTKFILGLPFLLLAAGLASCDPGSEGGAVPVRWDRIPDAERGLPPSIRVWGGVNAELPLRIYLVEVDLADSTLTVTSQPAAGADRRETPGDIARRTGACVLINGGYYWLDSNDRGRHIGLLAHADSVLASPLDRLSWQRVRYPVARATIGAARGGSPEIAWVSPGGRGVLRWDRPFDNRLGRPALPPDTAEAAVWPVRWAVQAGPMVVRDGEVSILREQEGFFDAYIPRIHPRSAVGLTADRRLLLVVVDGRQPHSRGVHLEELGAILADFGAEHAMNLDGGGSSALIVNGRLLNLPSGSETEREVVSSIAVHCPG